ncbi:hypothetical protein FXW30_04270 [Candidatus Liberibacter asiaticus]|nr:hypothetical protein FXW22_04220 [Candidatus Liberibacter asiaticus]KAE9511369.1 hypothetical protein FXW31_01835 [Candidatus Liberibacter asiaticus]KAE9511961.1 hypothetical protein FXW32_04290 [Candidatus Liberibacter asiaticus]KAE9513042.1 hypothetical protein FXW35_04335 [Candidatus Liberibacter asiaticus]KAE9514129.1 hypothetical protein FXW25_04140 [Candidatus Liberibacter asiaticus]
MIQFTIRSSFFILHAEICQYIHYLFDIHNNNVPILYNRTFDFLLSWLFFHLASGIIAHFSK